MYASIQNSKVLGINPEMEDMILERLYPHCVKTSGFFMCGKRGESEHHQVAGFFVWLREKLSTCCAPCAVLAHSRAECQKPAKN